MIDGSLRLAIGSALALLLACGLSQDPLEEIRVLHAKGQYSQSVARLREIIDDDPSRPEAHLLLGVAFLRTGRAGLAVWPLHVAAEFPDQAVSAGILLAQAMLQSRTAPDALAVVDRVVALEPENVDALVLRVHALTANGRPEEALAATDRVLELDPENLEVLVPRLTILTALGRIDEAEVALATARERMEARGDAIAVDLRARLCAAGGIFAFGKGDVDAADAAYADCLERFPTDPLTVSESIAFYEQIGRPERVTEILEQGLQDHGDSFFRVALARRKGAEGDADGEARLLREDAEARGSVAAWIQLADFHVRRDEYDRAIEAFEAAMATSAVPSPRLRFAYADTLVQAGRHEDARRIARELDVSPLRDLIQGRILLAEGDPHGALAALEAGIALWPNNAAARYLAGQAAERVGDFDRALSEYRESLRADAAQTSAGLELATLLSAHGDQAAALAAIQLHARSHPNDSAVFREAARIAWRAGERRAAAKYLTRLRRLPDQEASAVALHAELLAESQGAAKALAAIEDSDLDWTSPANALALRVLLETLAALGEHARAETKVAAALAAHPDSAVLHELHGEVKRASGAQRDEVRQSFERATEIDSDLAAAWAGLAGLAAEESDRVAALDLYDRAARADPDEAAHAVAAAELLIAAGETDRAALRLEQVLSRHPRAASAALALARIAAARGEIGDARQLAERAVWLRHADAEATLARIEGMRESRGTGEISGFEGASDGGG